MFRYVGFVVMTMILFFATPQTTYASAKSVHDFSAKNIEGQMVNLADYKGDVLLIVNVARQCGFTAQTAGLQDLYEKYREKGFKVLAFPSNQFADQEPGSNEVIASFYRNEYSVEFPLFSKIDVNGRNEHPLYTHLKSESPLGFKDRIIGWNFTKFLIDREGRVVARYPTQTPPEEIDPDIRRLL